MTIKPTPSQVETEIVTRGIGGIDPEQILRTKPHMAGMDMFTDKNTEVWVDLGRRDAGTDGAFTSGGPFISIAANSGDPDQTLDYDAIKLVGALALAIGDLRKVREAQA
jgi:hypothetical protein